MKRARNALVLLAGVFFIFGISWSILAREAFVAKESSLVTRIGMFMFQYIEYEGVPIIIAYASMLAAIIITVWANGRHWIESMRRIAGRP